jgi:2-polyprenyl-3-methyl-5-hydroxy-6-metoxy-1,4-benzoquinol methylase
MEKKRKNMRRYWDEVIQPWEATSYGLKTDTIDRIEKVAGWFRGHIADRQRTCLERLKAWVPGKVIMEIGCGSGSTCFELVRLGAKKVYGLDISSRAIETARRTAKENRIDESKAVFLTLEIGAHYVRPEPVDLLMGLGILEYVRPSDMLSFIGQVQPESIFFSFDEKTCDILKFLHFFYRRIKRIPYYKKYASYEICGLFKEVGFSRLSTFREGQNSFVWQL